jgi:hypothetical protein
MKNKKLARKLRLNKETIVDLNGEQMAALFGGKIATVITYDPPTVTGGCVCAQDEVQAFLFTGGNFTDIDCNE